MFSVRLVTDTKHYLNAILRMHFGTWSPAVTQLYASEKSFLPLITTCGLYRPCPGGCQAGGNVRMWSQSTPIWDEERIKSNSSITCPLLIHHQATLGINLNTAEWGWNFPVISHEAQMQFSVKKHPFRCSFWILLNIKLLKLSLRRLFRKLRTWCETGRAHQVLKSWLKDSYGVEIDSKE